MYLIYNFVGVKKKKKKKKKKKISGEEKNFLKKKSRKTYVPLGNNQVKHMTCQKKNTNRII